VVVGLTVCAAALAGCSSPATGTDSLAAGKERVIGLVDDAIRTLPPSAHAATVPTTGTTACRKKLLGFAVGTTGRHHVEAPVLVDTDAGTNPRSLLAAIEAKWRAQGYTIDRSGLGDARYPKITANGPGGYSAVATAIMTAPQRLDLYAVSPCLAGS
jgi:hypothetical protein